MMGTASARPGSQLIRRTQRLTDMRTLAVALLCAAVAGCGSPPPSVTPSASATPTATPTPAATPTVVPSPSPLPTVAFTCYLDPLDPVPLPISPPWLPSSYCPAEAVAVETAVASLGHIIESITITVRPMPCGPFPSGDARFCVLALTRPWAFVTFADTDMVAALTLALVTGGPVVANVIAFQVPPAGWSVP